MEMTPIELIRLKPHIYSDETVPEIYWLRDLVRDFLFLGVKNVEIQKFDRWWVIFSGVDWLEENGVISMTPFSKIIHFPVAGQEAMRTEVIVAALSKASFTFGRDGITWISGKSGDVSMPDDLQKKIKEYSHGRLLGFLAR